MAKSAGDKGEKMVKEVPTYIPCRVEPGMFRGELLVFVDDAADPSDPNVRARAQLLVDERDVTHLSGTPQRHNPAKGWLRVSLARKTGDWAVVVLPQPSQPFGEAILVNKDAVKENPRW
jgi:hypothetical protein